MKTGNAKKTSTVILTLIITVVLATAIIITVMMLMRKPKQEQIGNLGGTTEQVANTGNFHENGWDASIVAEIKDGVPVPVGFTYVSGDKQTGFIIQNKETGKKYIWIPSGKNTIPEQEKQNILNGYFENKESIQMNPDTQAEIEKYGGFYAGIDYVTEDSSEKSNRTTYEIATLNQEEYEAAKKQAQNENKNLTAVNTSLLGKEELAMVLEYNQSTNNQVTLNYLSSNIGMKENTKASFEEQKILFIGNSLFEQMENAITVNGIKAWTDYFIAQSGATFTEINPRITPSVASQYNIAVIEMGTNEAWTYNYEQYINAYTALIQTLKSAGVDCYLLSLPPVLPADSPKNAWAEYAYVINNDNMRTFSNWTAQVANNTGSKYVDCTPFFGNELREDWTNDGVHMTTNVYINWYLAIKEAVKQSYTTTPETPTEPETPITPEQPTTPKEPTTPAEPEEPKTVPAYTGEVITVKSGETKQEETPVPDKWKNTVATVINGVPVPKGFEVATYYGPADENTGFVIRQISSKESEDFYRLCYVWVPVNKNGNTIESLEDAKKALNEVYTKAGLNTQTSESATESLPNELVKSVKEYGGFYIAMGELGYDNNGKFYNRPRGMKESDTHKGWYGVDYGNYFHYTSEEYWNKTTPVNYVAAAATYDNIMKDFTLDKINRVCEMLSTESVTSHLTYGAEWDAAMLWILKRDASTSEDLTSLLLKDSSSIGKYKGSMFNAKMLNCTWGFAGNLAEVTQEKVEGKIVVRGGSYATLGSEQPIASRTAIEENDIRKDDQFGFRNCIYINLTEDATEPESELQALIDSGKATTDRITTVADKEGEKIAIPQGFKVTKDAYSIKEGVVIENAQGDQFVWVPVADINEMYNANEQSGKLYNITKNGSNLKVITSINDQYFEPGIVTGGTGKDIDANADNLKTLDLDSVDKLERQMKTEFNAMINSVKTHGGFYIARYETGNVDQEYPSVKQNAQNRTNLNWYQAYMKNQKIPTGNYGISGTIYGCQWDMALRWLQSCEASNQKVNHMEDFANGTAEWTMEAYANDARVVRDVTREESTVVQAGTRMDYNPNETKEQIGTRAMMYIR